MSAEGMQPLLTFITLETLQQKRWQTLETAGEAQTKQLVMDVVQVQMWQVFCCVASSDRDGAM